MADKSPIEWTDATWNPTVGCTILTPGCIRCYAMKQAMRLVAMAKGLGRPTHYEGTVKTVKGIAVWTGNVELAPENILTQPLRWKRQRKIFVNSMSDLFHENVPDEWIDRVFAVMALSPQHIFQVLTKRPERMREWSRKNSTGGHILHFASEIGNPSSGRWPLPNVWLGVSTEDQQRADERIPILLDTPAAIRWVSAEPLLGPIDLEPWLPWPEGAPDVDGKSWGCQECDTGCDCPAGKAHFDVKEGPTGEDGCPEWMTHDRVTIDWIVVGGESGKGARPMHPAWARSIRDQCAAAGVPFLFKQWGAWLDADELLGRIERGPGSIVRGGVEWQPARPLNFADAQTLASILGHKFEHHSDGSTMFLLDKSRAGRTIEGVEHNGYPAVAP